MEDLYLEDDSLLDELENKFHSNTKENSIDNYPFEVKINYEANDLYKVLTDDTNVDIKIDTTLQEENTNHNLIKRGRPKGSLKKVSREKIVDKKITISLSLEEKEALEEKAKEDDRSISSFIRIKLKEAGVFR